MRFPRFISVALILLASPAGAAEDPPPSHEFEEVVVTATRTERTTAEVPASVTVVEEQEIEDARPFGLKEALSDIAGVQSETKNGGYDSRLIIRGAGLKARYGVREIMVLLDGVPITDPDGLTRLDFVDTQMVKQIDVVKGPNSTLYGANAAGGVINIITRSPYEGVRSVKAGYGSDESTLFNVNYGGQVGETYYALTGTRKESDSWREWNEFVSSRAGVKLGRILEDGSSLEGSISYTEADLQLPGSLTEAQFHSDPSQLTDEPFRHSSRDSRIVFTSLKYEKEFDAFTLKPLVYFQDWHHLHPVPGKINDGGAEVYGMDLQGDLPHGLGSGSGLLTLGSSLQIDEASGEKYAYRDVDTAFSPFPPPGSSRIVATRSDRKGDLIQTDSETVLKWGLYAQESLRPTASWIIDLGLRFDHVSFDIDSEIDREYSYARGSYVPSNRTVDVDRSFDQLSPRIGALYKATPYLNFYGTISTGFQTPQASELDENPRLEPAVTVNYEAGAKIRTESGHSLDLALYHMDVSDEIVQTRLEDGDVAYHNAGESTRRGAEATLALRPLEGLEAVAVYTYSDYEFDRFMEPIAGRVFDRSGNQHPYIPRHQYSFSVRYRHRSGLRFVLNTSTWGDYYVDNANSETYTGYDFLTNALVGWKAGGWDVSFDVKNVFDKQYAMEVSKETRGDLMFRPGAPRTFFLKAQYTW